MFLKRSEVRGVLLSHLQLLDSSLQGLRVQIGLFGGQLVLSRLEPPDQGTREAPELQELLLAGLNHCKPWRKQERKLCSDEFSANLYFHLFETEK